MNLVICPGIHNPSLTEEFLAGLQSHRTSDFSKDNSGLDLKESVNLLIFPAADVPPYSAIQVFEFLQQHCDLDKPLVIIGFSAGVVGSMGAAWLWQHQGGQVQALLALDGWGVPQLGNFPIHRLSHDYFTHWSSRLLGSGADSFYADPGVDHLDLWRSPQQIQGWWEGRDGRDRATALEAINRLLKRYAKC